MSSNSTGFHARLLFAWARWQGIHKKKLSQAVLGRMVGDYGGKAIDQSKVSRWFTETVPDLTTMAHLARALEVDPGWLAFGDASHAPAPTDPVRPRPMPKPKPGR